MSDIAIRVENLSKRYRIGLREEMPDTLIGAMTNWLKSPMTNFWQLRKLSHFSDNGHDPEDVIWALKDVSFEVKQGEVVGIIGRNGAGKSTLLKILSRITEPTSGRAIINGRVSSLLEVGTGFHPELTGRENIYLNGTVLGMSKPEIDHKFDEIVDFSGVEKFIDTPVKRYSSGMQVRLAFAVAAHLEPEILLVDEVLAVGDAEFQKKCLGKMERVAKEGRTVFFVSHAMPTIIRLCPRAILLNEGKIAEDGSTPHVVGTYIQSNLGTTAKREWPDPTSAPGNNFVRIRSVRVVDTDLQIVESVDIRKPVGIETVFEVLEQKTPFIPMIALYNDQGVHVFNALDTNSRWQKPCKIGRYTSIAWIPGNLLNEGLMIVSVLLNTLAPGKVTRQAVATEAVAFQAVDSQQGDSAKGQFNRQWGGAVSPLLRWTTEYSNLLNR
jgi:lipopolysaccharide transport system ATP-binding protein